MLDMMKRLIPYTAWLVIAAVLIFIMAMTDLYLPNIMAEIVDVGIVNGDVTYILQLGAVMLGVALIGVVASVSANYFSSRVAMSFGRDLRRAVFEKVESFSLAEFNEVGTASLITRTTNDIKQIEQVILMGFRMMAQAPLLIVGALIMAARKDLELTKIILIIIPFIILTLYVVARFAMPLFKQLQSRIDKLNLVIRENLTGIRVIRVFNKVEVEQDRFNKSSNDLADVAIKANRLMGLLMPLMMLILNLSIVAIMWFGSNRVVEGSLEVGNLMAFIQYMSQIMFSLIMLSMLFVLIPRAQASIDRLQEVLSIEPSIKDSTDTKTSALRGVVEFKNVAFGYDKAEEYAIENVSFKAMPGEVTAIIGGTGAGKSTLLNMIPRFYDTAAGEVLVDGVDVREMSQASLREKIGYVPQKAMLFTGSIRENIQFGKEDASDEEIIHALTVAQAKDFVEKMDGVLEAKISQGGTNVSGGQKQRLSIARAIVRRPEIYLFDDSFSALDFKTDATLRKALKAETDDATVIIVAQRVATIMDADRILVMEDGKIVGQGRHDELMQTCDVYQEIVRSQLKGEEV